MKKSFLILILISSFFAVHNVGLAGSKNRAHKGEDLKYYVSICTIFQNEAPYFKEWIEYHRMIGVEHFYLLNNESTDHYYEVLIPYINRGIVELIDWPGESDALDNWVIDVQCTAYNTIIEEKKRESFWIAFIDVDEFIVLTDKGKIGPFLSEYEKYAGLVVNWQLYGTSNISKIPEGKTLIGTLTKKAPTQFERNKHVKSIVRSEAVSKFKDNPHAPKYKKHHSYPVNERKEKCRGAQTACVHIDKIRLNHYTYRDEAFYYQEKLARLKKWFPDVMQKEPDPSLSAVEDLILAPFAKDLEKKLFSSSE